VTADHRAGANQLGRRDLCPGFSFERPAQRGALPSVGGSVPDMMPAQRIAAVTDRRDRSRAPSGGPAPATSMLTQVAADGLLLRALVVAILWRRPAGAVDIKVVTRHSA
jgi:hypothetical protein